MDPSLSLGTLRKDGFQLYKTELTKKNAPLVILSLAGFLCAPAVPRSRTLNENHTRKNTQNTKGILCFVIVQNHACVNIILNTTLHTHTVLWCDLSCCHWPHMSVSLFSGFNRLNNGSSLSPSYPPTQLHTEYDTLKHWNPVTASRVGLALASGPWDTTTTDFSYYSHLRRTWKVWVTQTKTQQCFCQVCCRDIMGSQGLLCDSQKHHSLVEMMHGGAEPATSVIHTRNLDALHVWGWPTGFHNVKRIYTERTGGSQAGGLYGSIPSPFACEIWECCLWSQTVSIPNAERTVVFDLPAQ